MSEDFTDQAILNASHTAYENYMCGKPDDLVGLRAEWQLADAAVLARMSPSWQPMKTAIKSRETKVDLWLRDNATSREWRKPDCFYGNGWQNDGRWITGRKVRDAYGKEYLDQHLADDTSVVALFWMLPPIPPSQES